MLGPLGASRIIGGHLGTFGSLLVHPGHVWDTAGHIDRSARFTRSARLRAALASRFGGQTASREHLSSVPEALMLHHVGSNLVPKWSPEIAGTTTFSKIRVRQHDSSFISDLDVFFGTVSVNFRGF